ncbi:MAG: orotidine-5'-phosphate decarboxylase [Actinobacteria bacterium]|nr:orotidine-5'-phosphate decarboxylase [Actinomycetota bacterium]MDA8375432.1 orotidine-5'-phosphate decarboxylase [Actinomycetota bacterium]
MDRLAIALDTDDSVEALRWARDYRDVFGFAKVGLELFTSEGPGIIYALRELGYKVFLDLKMHDIPNTVKRAARVVGGYGVDLLTVHAAGGVPMLRAAVEGLSEGAAAAGSATEPRVLAVTFLTSDPAVDQIAFIARLDAAAEAGCGGYVCAAAEVEMAKERHPELFALVPGIRFKGAEVDDQGRVATPSVALAKGADLIVIGRSVTRAADPAVAIAMLKAEAAAF